ncbi:Olfactory receptor 497 [Lemmus lemmus]
MGNVLIILVTTADSALQSPMYFFLRNLSFLEIGFNLVIVPKMLDTLILQDKTISFLGCATQMYFFFFFGAVECFLLAAMAYDHFVAICNPLLCSTKMSTQVCIQLIAGSYIGGFLNSSSFAFSFLSFVFCGPNRVKHFYCDFAPLLELSCSDVCVTAVVTSFSAASVTMITALVIAVSYTYILITILKMRSTKGRDKAFSTCASHLSCHSVLWNYHLHLCDAQVQLLHRPEQGGVCVLHGGDPHAEPPHL